MNRVAIITARSGSKGLKDKNIIDICGKPLLAYSIEAAVESQLFNRVIVTTDSPLYADISRQYGAEVMMRGEELSGDNVATFPVLKDVLSRLDEKPDYFVLLQPTSPMRRAHHVREAVALFESDMENYDFLVSMTAAHFAQVLVKPIEPDLSLKYFDSDFSNYRRQGYAEYSPNGAIAIAKPDAYLERKHCYGARSRAYIMDKHSSVDIDDEIDYKLACLLVEEELKNSK